MNEDHTQHVSMTAAQARALDIGGENPDAATAAEALGLAIDEAQARPFSGEGKAWVLIEITP